MHRPSFGTSLGIVLLLAACGGSNSNGTTPNGATTQPTSGVTPGFPTAGVGTAATSGTGLAPTSGTGAAAGRTGASSGTGANVPGASAGTAATTSGGMSGGVPAAGSGMSNPGDMGNMFASGAWHGYAWTSASGPGSMISPMDFSGQTTGMPRCVKGSVGAAMDYSGTAMLGFNLADGNGQTTVTPTKAGVMIDVKNNAMSPLRFQVMAGTGASQQRWCVTISGSGGFIPWSSLNTECWAGGMGVAYKNEPISAAAILVPGGATAAVPFDFCLNSLAEADMPAGGVSGTGGGSGSGGAMAAGSGGSGGGATSGTGATAGTAGMPPTGGGKYPPITGGCTGHATRYWDCCKPHCGWAENVSGGSPLPSCDRSDNNVGADAANSCTGGNGFMCHSLAPWSVDSQTAFGYAAVAVAAGGDICGKCYQLQFSGSSFNGGNDSGSAALNGKTMIVQAINIGGDVASGQFDIAIPGGGVGQFNACSSQWGVPSSQLGPTYGGFLAACKAGANASDHQALKTCVKDKCKSVFEAKGLTELAAGCNWFVDWFEVADNPSFKYQQIACPAELSNKGVKRNAGASNACLR